MTSEETTETITRTESSVKGGESRELTEIEQKYYEVLKLEHQKWKKIYDQNRNAVKETKSEIVRSSISGKQKEKFEKDLGEIDKYFSQIDDLDSKIGKAATNVQQYEQLSHSLYSTWITNVYDDINKKISNYD